MFVKLSCVFLIVSVVIVSTLSQKETESASFRLAFKLYDECRKSDGFVPCLKKKAVTFIDRVSRVDSLPLIEGFNIMKNNDVQIAPVVSETELDNSLPRNLEARDQALDNMIVDKLASFISSRKIQLAFPTVTSQDLSRGIEEGRGKMKKMMGMMMAGLGMKMAALIPLAIAGLFLLAGKALLTAKIALLLSVIIGLKKLLAQKNQGGGHDSHSSGWQSGGGGQGWDRRSYEAAQKLAYKGYVPQE